MQADLAIKRVTHPLSPSHLPTRLGPIRATPAPFTSTNRFSTPSRPHLTRSNSGMPRPRATHSAPDGDPAARAHHPLLDAINESTKWTVSAAVFATLGVMRDLTCAWWVLGSIFAAVLCRGLKYTLNHARPPTAPKADPGMPSAHANSLGFLSTFVAVWAAAAAGGRIVPLSVGVLATALFLTWLRVALGYHTVAQVAVGWVLGSSIALGWWQVGAATALPAVAASPVLQKALYGVTTAAMAYFIGSNGARWVREAQMALAKER